MGHQKQYSPKGDLFEVQRTGRQVNRPRLTNNDFTDFTIETQR